MFFFMNHHQYKTTKQYGCKSFFLSFRRVSIGVTTGTTFCGVVGHPNRHEYSGIMQIVFRNCLIVLFLSILWFFCLSVFYATFSFSDSFEFTTDDVVVILVVYNFFQLEKYISYFQF